jgi:hypothetical protein
MQLEYGQFCKLKNSTIFGTYAGQVENTLNTRTKQHVVVANSTSLMKVLINTGESKTQSWFFDEELNKLIQVSTRRLVPMERYK